MLLPIPDHLKEIFHPLGEENNEFSVTGELVCTCGCSTFSLEYEGQVRDGYLCEVNRGGHFHLAVYARCQDCGKEYLVFDENQHGWNGFVAGEEVPPLPIRELYACKSCKENASRLVVGIESQGKEDFLEESGYGEPGCPFGEEDWVNAFEWITLSITCQKCGEKLPNWLDAETM